MAYDTATAIIFIGTVFLMFKFSDSIETDLEWAQPLKLLVNMIGMFMLLAGVGWALQLQRTTAGVDASLPDITVGILVGLGFVVVPVFFFFLVLFVKELLLFWEKMKKGKDFSKD